MDRVAVGCDRLTDGTLPIVTYALYFEFVIWSRCSSLYQIIILGETPPVY